MIPKPQTDGDLDEAIKALGFGVADQDGDFVLVNKDGDEVSMLDAQSLSDALHEAWCLVRPIR